MKKKQLILLFLLVLTAVISRSQNRTISGRIIDSASQQALSGVSIVPAGSTTGTQTDSDGRFQLTVPPGISSLLITMTNYQSLRIALDQFVEGSPLTISLTRAATEMEQVIVVGYGTQRKKDLTGAVSTISAEDVGGRQTVQVSEALQGAVAGVSVTRGSGAPGASANILVRGITTLGTNSPLIIVDGIPVSSIDNVNPNDVASLTVLKDAASAAIYGSRGAAGVILITTKRAKSGQAQMEYTYEYGVQRPTRLPEFVNGPDYMRYFNEQQTNDGATAGSYPQAFIDNFADSNRLNPDQFPFANTNWQELLMERNLAPRQRHDLVFTMGTGKLKTKASMGYTSAGSFFDQQKFDRYQVRINNDLQVMDNLLVSLDMGYRRVYQENPISNPFYEARVMPSIYDDFYSDGRYALSKDGRNPVAQLREGGSDEAYLNQLTGRLSLQYRPLKGLTLTALVAPTLDFNKGKRFSKRIDFTNPDGTPSSLSNIPRTILTETRQESTSITGQLLADYSTEFGEGHSLGVLGGYEELYFSDENTMASRSGFALTDFPYLNAGSQEFRDNSGTASENALRSFFGRLQYNYKNKYYLQGNLRYDQSSRFAAQYRDALFPSIAAGWTISEEGFMQSVNWLSFLKLRASYGSVGNERIGNYPYQSLIAFSNALFYQNGVVVPLNGGAQQVYAVENISWETTKTTNIGLDASFFSNRLSVSADYYQKKTRDILLSLDIPLFIGFDKPSQNAGTMEVKGWELETSWRDKVGKLRYTIGFNLSDSKSKILDMRGTQILGAQSTFEGSEFNEWFGYRSNGLYQTIEDTVGSPRLNNNVTAGDVRYEDVNKDGRITPDDRVLLGGSLPRYLYGATIRLEYNRFDFGLVVQGVGKRNSRLNEDLVRPFAEAFGNVPNDIVGKFWSRNNSAEQNMAARYPRLSTRSLGNNYEMSDFWLINGAYFRMKNITLGYTIPLPARNGNTGKTCRVYFSANDVWTISNFPRYADPESNSYSYPIVTTMMVGATIRL
ncbi:SusC/RagA family TonB-linked outer membrane protein [Flavihumibacter sp. UBA7668]|uniref:SusC/RagA family TonB-linked outer membrane protein n=1 Tax=Flavihumibacter sp. UBA7668 TaxID=1946542 RepID=UPI0025C54E8A|nr:TonB-dependent receptor [Flavihumibacter sp. UBA7668]